MTDSEDYFQRMFTLTEEQKKRLIPIWIERIVFVFANLWIGPSGMRYQNYLAEASELLNQVAAKKMSKHTAMLEELEDKAETASFAALMESKGQANMITASLIADATQSSLKVFLDQSATPEHALSLCLAVMAGLSGEDADDTILSAALHHDIDYVTGNSNRFFRPLWPNGRPPKWPGQSLSYVSMGLSEINLRKLAEHFYRRLKFLNNSLV